MSIGSRQKKIWGENEYTGKTGLKIRGIIGNNVCLELQRGQEI